MDETDMIYQITNDGDVLTGEYKFNNSFLHNNMGPYTVIEQKGGSIDPVSSVIGGLAIPTGLLFLQQNYNRSNTYSSTKKGGVVSNSLYDSLLSMIEEPSKKNASKSNGKTRKTRKTRNKRSASNKKTKSRR